GMHLLIDDGDLGVEFQAGTFATSRAFLKDHRDTVLRFTRAISQGIKYYKTNKEGSEKALSDFTKTTDQAELDESWQLFALKYTSKVPNLTVKGTQYVMDNVIKNPEVKNHKPEDFMDMSVVQQLKDEGLYQQLWGNDQAGV
ncbi:MAG: ABC transporter substrate-binding protein, partial [Chloroflexota bacterium]